MTFAVILTGIKGSSLNIDFEVVLDDFQSNGINFPFLMMKINDRPQMGISGNTDTTFWDLGTSNAREFIFRDLAP